MLLSIVGVSVKILLVILIIGAMVIALMAINYYVSLRGLEHGTGLEEKLREDVRKSDDVISRQSVFHDFLARDMTRPQRHSYKPGK